MNTRNALRRWQLLCAGVVALLAVSSAHAQTSPPTTCERTVKADVVALDQALIYNRLGAINPAGMIYALKRDVVAIDPSKGLVAGNVQLRPGKRPRPIALRMNVGDCLQINFTNLLAPDIGNINTSPPDNDPNDEEAPDPPEAQDFKSFAANNAPATRTASAHIMGLQLVGTIASDGSNVGQNPSSLVAPGASATYTYIAQREGNHLVYSTAATTGGEGDGGSLAMGLFGSVNVELKGAEWYRSQLTAEEMALATVKNEDGTPKYRDYADYIVRHERAPGVGLRRADRQRVDRERRRPTVRHHLHPVPRAHPDDAIPARGGRLRGDGDQAARVPRGERALEPHLPRRPVLRPGARHQLPPPRGQLGPGQPERRAGADLDLVVVLHARHADRSPQRDLAHARPQPDRPAEPVQRQ